VFETVTRSLLRKRQILSTAGPYDPAATWLIFSSGASLGPRPACPSRTWPRQAPTPPFYIALTTLVRALLVVSPTDGASPSAGPQDER